MHALGIEDPGLLALLNSAAGQRLLGAGEGAAAASSGKVAHTAQEKPGEPGSGRRRRASRRDRADSLGAPHSDLVPAPHAC